MHLSCITDGKPLPLVTWTKVGDIINASNPDGQWFTIKKAKTTDAGTYRCTAINGVGKPAVATRQVIVFCKLMRSRHHRTDTFNTEKKFSSMSLYLSVLRAPSLKNLLLEE